MKIFIQSFLLCLFFTFFHSTESSHLKSQRRRQSPSHRKDLTSQKLLSLRKNSVGPKLSAADYDKLYGPWSKWSHCSKRCSQHRSRQCKNGKSCEDSTITQARTCIQGRCQATRRSAVSKVSSRRIEDVVYDLLYYDWSEWSTCTRSCKRNRYRTCALKRWCKNTILLEERRCYVEGTACEKRFSQSSEADKAEPTDEKDSFTYDEEGKKKPVKVKPTTVPYDSQTCGIRPDKKELRIVGGYESRKGSWPWQVAILTKWQEQYCGGALIAPQWVLTAAHCVRKRGRRRRVLVRIGEHDLSTTDGKEIEMKVATDFVHPDFDIDTIDSDIALLKLRSPVETNERINFACIPETEDHLPINTLCYAMGWGKMQDTHIFGTDYLHEAPVPLVDGKKCQEAFEYEITNNQMCAGYKRGGVDTCAGDSGGPLMCEIEKDGESRWYAYGVTSFGEGCGDKGKYGIYTIVNKFSNWIVNVTRNN